MNISELEIKIIKTIDKSVQKDEALKKVRDVIQDVPEFNIREKARAYLAAKKLVQTGWKPNNMQIKRFCIAMSKINERSRSRSRTQKTAGMLREGRAGTGVFYLSSIHSNPACGHADYQGTVYVDRYWKSTLSDNPELLKKVAAYIRNHDVMTVQEVCGAPVFLVTRPYCKHFFIPLSIEEVLGNSVNKIKKNHPEAHVTEHNIDYRKKFYKQRKRIHTVLGMTGEARKDEMLIKKREA